MSLPEILPPAGTPVFQERGHARTRRSVYADAPRGTGHARRRRMRTSAPGIVTVSWFLEAAHAQAVENWFETTLQAGTLSFSAHVARIGGQWLEWWSAQWLVPPSWSALPFGRWRLSGQLLLTGEASLTGPVSTSASVEFAASLVGAATPAISNDAQVDFSAALRTAALASVEFTADLAAVKNGADPSDVDRNKRWIWMRYPYARGRSADVTDTSEFDQRSWMGI